MELSTTNYDFAGWATCCNIKCTDGRTIMPDAFKHHDGEIVPLVWNHDYSDPYNILGKALLHSRDGGLYAYCQFNDTESGIAAKELVRHGDICSLSIMANQLQYNAGRGVTHGMVRELSLVLAGANKGARIESVVMKHGDEFGEDSVARELSDDEGIIYSGEYLTLYHAETPKEKKEEPKMAEETKKDEKSDKTETPEKSDKTVKEVFDEMTEEQKTVVYAMIGQALEDAGVDTEDEDEADKEDTVKHSEGGNEDMKTNVFDQENVTKDGVLTHADQEEIIKLAKASNVGSLQNALSAYIEGNDTLKHGIDEIETLFPEYKDVRPGAPELIERDQTWVGEVMRKTHKSPISRIRTRQADARGADLRAHGYQKKGDEKTVSGNIKLMGRTTDPQTIYRKDALHRDDIIDITDFDVVEYQYGVMKRNIYEDIALATMVGDLREDGDPDKISEEHIRPIWKDDELYTIHYDVDVAAAKAELQGSDTSVNFGENYIYAEALVTAALYSREQYKGSGNLEFYCTPHLLNVMLLARDLNGRRIYDSKADLAKALNVSAIHTAEQFEGLTRTTKEGATKKLLGLFVNLNDYQHGSTKGGEITRFEQFDIDFNQQKYLIETRLSGALTRIKSAIALEEPVTAD